MRGQPGHGRGSGGGPFDADKLRGNPFPGGDRLNPRDRMGGDKSGGRTPPDIDALRQQRGAFGDLSNIRGMFDKSGGAAGGGGGHRMADMLHARRFDHNGDGPIFNDLNNKAAEGKLSAEELQKAREKLS